MGSGEIAGLYLFFLFLGGGKGGVGFVGAHGGNHRGRESSQKIAGMAPTTWERKYPEQTE